MVLWHCLDSVSPFWRVILIVNGLEFGLFSMAWGILGSTWKRMLTGVVVAIILVEIGGNVLVDWLLRV